MQFAQAKGFGVRREGSHRPGRKGACLAGISGGREHTGMHGTHLPTEWKKTTKV